MHQKQPLFIASLFPEHYLGVAFEETWGIVLVLLEQLMLRPHV